MKRDFAIRRLLAILLIAALVLAPVSRPVMAEMSSGMSMQAMPAASASAMLDEMANDMPCCPSRAPAPVDCDKCVFMAACGSVCFVGIPAAISHPFPVLSDAIALQRNDTRPVGLGRPPPEHPPRSLV